MALYSASCDARKKGYCFKIYDAYRPMSAVNHFLRWANDESDQRTKPLYYPDLNKSDIISGGYISPTSSHTRGSAIDLTLVCADSGEELDMGGPFDFFGELSHPDYEKITAKQQEMQSFLTFAALLYFLKHDFRFGIDFAVLAERSEIVCFPIYSVNSLNTKFFASRSFVLVVYRYSFYSHTVKGKEV